MTDDKIAEIRARHDAVNDVLRGASQMHADRGYLLAEVERLHKAHEAACRGGEWLLAEKVSLRARMCGEISDLRAEIERLRDEDTKTRHALRGWVWVCPDGGDEPTHERVSAVVAEVERLREALVLKSEVLASHQGSPGREWHSAGAWLYPGDSINVVRAPLPEMEAKP